MALGSSGSYAFAPDVAALLRDAFSRIQIFAPAITNLHVIEGRMSMNLWLAERSGNYGPNLFAVDQINLALVPGQVQFSLPPETVELLDVYVRNFTPNGSPTNIGNALTPLGPAGNPLVTAPYGDPLLIGPASGVFSCTAGSQLITMYWPAHGLVAGEPIFWGCPTSIGAINLNYMSVASTIIDSDTLQFYAPSPALETQTLQGATPLFSTTNGSPNVSCILPSHGLTAGATFSVPIATTVGGLALTGAYTVASVQSSYQFTFNPALGNANADASVFENGGQISVDTQLAGSQTQDQILYPLSRNDYAALPEKNVTGRPTTFWFNRNYPPNFFVYPVTPVPTGTLPQQYYGFMAYRLRQIQDANPVSGQKLDAPPRFFEAFVAGICAKLAEKFAPAQHATKLLLAEKAWEAFSSADVEHASLSISPEVGAYYR